MIVPKLSGMLCIVVLFPATKARILSAMAGGSSGKSLSDRRFSSWVDVLLAVKKWKAMRGKSLTQVGFCRPAEFAEALRFSILGGQSPQKFSHVFRQRRVAEGKFHVCFH